MTYSVNPTLVDRSVTATASSAKLMDANPQRRSLFIQNVSAVNIGITIDGGTAAIGTKGTVTLTPNAVLAAEGADCPQNRFDVVSASGNADVTAWETV